MRATSIAFHFMLALGPALVFFLTLIPYLPISNLETQLMEIVYDVIPENSYIALESLVCFTVYCKKGTTDIWLSWLLFSLSRKV
jgi:uncharacterized BrkB/YihY/UPF0761 family membrane protein